MIRRIEPDERDVLDDFLSEPSTGRDTLELYLRLYPSHADAILDLYHSIQRPIEAASGAEVDEAWVARGVAKLRQRLHTHDVVDPFKGLKPARFNAIKAKLGIRSSTLTGFRDRLVAVATVPSHVLRALAEALEVALEDFKEFLELPPRQAAGTSYRADGKPQAPGEKVSFEELLQAANEPAEVRARLLKTDL